MAAVDPTTQTSWSSYSSMREDAEVPLSTLGCSKLVQAEEIIAKHAKLSSLVFPGSGFPLVQRVESHLRSVCEVVCLREEIIAICAGDRVQQVRGSDAEWENVWHNERHTRCRANLLKHLYWACEKDIYRLSRRNDQHNHVALNPYPPGSPFVSVVEARVFLRSRRDRKRRSAAGGSITDECCQASGGCTWEEYAEYCPANKRLRKFL
uniref:(California timema) hypothetical protein n=1 Tax=Timema californicum TaxID=61474 RepID=A0A7R9JA14_TIMCA|nr:unnamed protein product [Timema californicum]